MSLSELSFVPPPVAEAPGPMEVVQGLNKLELGAPLLWWPVTPEGKEGSTEDFRVPSSPLFVFVDGVAAVLLIGNNWGKWNCANSSALVQVLAFVIVAPIGSLVIVTDGLKGISFFITRSCSVNGPKLWGSVNPGSWLEVMEFVEWHIGSGSSLTLWVWIRLLNPRNGSDPRVRHFGSPIRLPKLPNMPSPNGCPSEEKKLPEPKVEAQSLDGFMRRLFVSPWRNRSQGLTSPTRPLTKP